MKDGGQQCGLSESLTSRMQKAYYFLNVKITSDCFLAGKVSFHTNMTKQMIQQQIDKYIASNDGTLILL